MLKGVTKPNSGGTWRDQRASLFPIGFSSISNPVNIEISALNASRAQILFAPNRREKILLNMTRPRGRPKRSDIAVLIVQGINSESAVKCRICKRTFPRRKNLNTHILTHSVEKKYQCDFPHCSKCFKQSSQLKNHLLLHSKEKPFICPAEGCLARFTHSGRICPSHSGLKLVKQPETAEEIRGKFYRNVENVSEADKVWFEEYLSKRERKSPPASGKRKIGDVENVPEIHKGIMKVSDSEDSINKWSESEDSIMKVSDSEDSINKWSESEDSIMKVSDSEDSINKWSESEDSSMGMSDIADSIIEGIDSECSLMQVSDSGESTEPVSDIEGIPEDVITKENSNNEEMHQDQNVNQDGLLFYAFVVDLCKKGKNSRALFENTLMQSLLC